MNFLSIFLLPGIAFLFTVAFGFWLSRSGKPYNAVLFNLHKLIALTACIICILKITDISKIITIPTASTILLVLAGLNTASLFLSGAWMSANRLNQGILRKVHQFGVGTLIIAVAGAFVFL